MENKPRGESINKIGKTEGGGTLDGIPPHRFEPPLKRVGCALIGQVEQEAASDALASAVRPESKAKRIGRGL